MSSRGVDWKGWLLLIGLLLFIAALSLVTIGGCAGHRRPPWHKAQSETFTAAKIGISHAKNECEIDDRCFDENGIFNPDLGADDLDCGNDPCVWPKPDSLK